jgi:hypothetical protein
MEYQKPVMISVSSLNSSYGTIASSDTFHVCIGANVVAVLNAVAASNAVAYLAAVVAAYAVLIAGFFWKSSVELPATSRRALKCK